MTRRRDYQGRINVFPNPIYPYGTFAASYIPGRRREQFSSIDIIENAFGKFYRMLFLLHDTKAALDELFEVGLNYAVRAVAPGYDVDFDGFINGMRYTEEGQVRRRSLEDIATSIRVRYEDSAGSPQTAVASDPALVARYGTIELPSSGGTIESSSQATKAAQIILASMKNAQPVVENLSTQEGGGETGIEVEVLGWQEKLARRVYNQTVSTGTQSADLEIADILTATAEFVAPAALWRLSPNTVAMRKDYNSDRDPLGIIYDGCRLGDALAPPNPWCFYFDVDMVPVYEPKAPATKVVL